MVQESEMLTLVFGVLGLMLAPRMLDIRGRVADARFFAGLATLAAAFGFTVLEGFVLPAVFNVLEHLAYLLASVFFYLALTHREDWIRPRDSSDAP